MNIKLPDREQKSIGQCSCDESGSC